MASEKIISPFDGSYFLPYGTFHNTTKNDVTTELNKLGTYYMVYIVMFDMTDSTEAGYYLVMRNGLYSSTPRYVKLAS